MLEGAVPVRRPAPQSVPERSSRTRIASVEVLPLTFPLARPFRAAVRLIPSVDLVVVRVRDSEGRRGSGTAFAFGSQDARPIAAVAQSLGELLVGADAVAPEANWQTMSHALALAGMGGPALAALGAIDIALWDLLGRIAEQPLSRLLGGARERIATYGSGGSLDLGIDELVAEAHAFMAAGHRAIKIKAGGGDSADHGRLAALRAALGSDIRIAADGNQQWSPKGAIRWARQMEEHDLWWLEEPVAASDVAGHSEVRQAIAIDVATGETLYGVGEAARFVHARAADVLMPNLQRMGGITPWRKLAALAELAGIPVASHVHPEVQVHLMCAIPNAVALECWPGWPWLASSPLDISDGACVPPSAPGLGFEPDDALIEAHRADR